MYTIILLLSGAHPEIQRRLLPDKRYIGSYPVASDLSSLRAHNINFRRGQSLGINISC